MDNSINFENQNLNNQYLKAILDNDFEKMNDLLGALHQEKDEVIEALFDEQYHSIKNKIFLYTDRCTFHDIESALEIIDDETRDALVERIKNYKNSINPIDQNHEEYCEKAIQVIQNKQSDQYGRIIFVIFHDKETLEFLKSKTPNIEEFITQQAKLFQNELKSNKYYIKKTISEYNEEINRYNEEINRYNEKINRYNEEINELQKLLGDPNLPEFPDENTPRDLTDDEKKKIQILDKQITNLEKLIVVIGKERNPFFVVNTHKTQETQTDLTLTHDPEMNNVEKTQKV